MWGEWFREVIQYGRNEMRGSGRGWGHRDSGHGLVGCGCGLEGRCEA